MPYFVTGSDGNEYGPVDQDTLVQWVRENRVLPTTILKDATSGQTFQASSIGGLFAAAQPMTPPPGTQVNPPYQQPNFTQPPQPMTGYPRQAQNNFYDADPFPWRAFIYPTLALLWFFMCGGLGFIFGGYGIVYSYQTHQAGSKYGIAALVYSIICMLAVVGGYFLGMRGMMIGRA